MAVGTFLILLGGLFLLKNLGLISEINFDILWPIVVIAVGVYLVLQKRNFLEK